MSNASSKKRIAKALEYSEHDQMKSFLSTLLLITCHVLAYGDLQEEFEVAVTSGDAEKVSEVITKAQQAKFYLTIGPAELIQVAEQGHADILALIAQASDKIEGLRPKVGLFAYGDAKDRYLTLKTWLQEQPSFVKWEVFEWSLCLAIILDDAEVLQLLLPHAEEKWINSGEPSPRRAAVVANDMEAFQLLEDTAGTILEVSDQEYQHLVNISIAQFADRFYEKFGILERRPDLAEKIAKLSPDGSHTDEAGVWYWETRKGPGLLVLQPNGRAIYAFTTPARWAFRDGTVTVRRIYSRDGDGGMYRNEKGAFFPSKSGYIALLNDLVFRLDGEVISGVEGDGPKTGDILKRRR